jgi:hypothetical protein
MKICLIKEFPNGRFLLDTLRFEERRKSGFKRKIAA